MSILISDSFPKTARFLGVPTIATQINTACNEVNTACNEVHSRNCTKISEIMKKNCANGLSYLDVRLIDQLSCLVLAAFLDINAKYIQISNIENDILRGVDAIYRTNGDQEGDFKIAIDFTVSGQFIESKFNNVFPDGTKLIKWYRKDKPVGFIVVHIAEALIMRVLEHLEYTVFSNTSEPNLPRRDVIKMEIRDKVLQALYLVDRSPAHIIRLHTGISNPQTDKFQQTFQEAFTKLTKKIG